MALDDTSLEIGKMDLGKLYRQETFTDLGLGSIQCLTPVTPDGAPDSERKAIFIGTAQIMTAHGPIPVQSEIKAGSIRAACEAFPQAMQDAVKELVEKARQIERERQGGIVIPRGGRLELP